MSLGFHGCTITALGVVDMVGGSVTACIMPELMYSVNTATEVLFGVVRNSSATAVHILAFRKITMTTDLLGVFVCLVTAASVVVTSLCLVTLATDELPVVVSTTGCKQTGYR